MTLYLNKYISCKYEEFQNNPIKHILIYKIEDIERYLSKNDNFKSIHYDILFKTLNCLEIPSNKIIQLEDYKVPLFKYILLGYSPYYNKFIKSEFEYDISLDQKISILLEYTSKYFSEKDLEKIIIYDDYLKNNTTVIDPFNISISCIFDNYIKSKEIYLISYLYEAGESEFSLNLNYKNILILKQ